MIVLGNKELLNEKLAAVLNSSQSKTPCGNDPWVINTVKAVSELLTAGYTIISSTGLTTWELVIHITGRSGGCQVILSPEFDDRGGEQIFQGVLSSFDLSPTRTAMLFIKPETDKRSPKENWLKRDRAIISLAQKVVPSAIPPGGRLMELIALEEFRNKISDDNKIKYEKSIVRPPHYDLSGFRKISKSWDYLTHWTKTCHGPWPGQKAGEYYASVLRSGNEYEGNAFNTLINIIKEGKIRASAEKIREGRKAIGFTDAPPESALGLLRWCPRQVNWNFEPFGVVIEKVFAQNLGIRPVTYGTDKDYRNLAEAEKPYFQSVGKADVDWSREREWRKIGDLDLSVFPEEKIKYLVWNENDAKKIRGICRNEVVALAKD
jgi:hypothetical protein